METEQDHLKTLTEIRNLMEKSSRFISLSGLSGVFAGFFALIGALCAFLYLEMSILSDEYYQNAIIGNRLNIDFILFFFIDGLIVLFLAITFGILFTVRNSRKKGVPIWGVSARLTIINLFIPLVAGGLFCFILLYHHIIYLIAPATLVFYGLALVNASKYTFKEIRYLGMAEILIGLIACICIGYGLLFWALGFGVLHIIYGTVMFSQYER
ncbi:MAG: hypothetical protein V1904_02735 [Bacteroidota bacterium]